MFSKETGPAYAEEEREGRAGRHKWMGLHPKRPPADAVLERISISICISGTQTAKAAAVTVRHNPNKGPSIYDVLNRRGP